MENVYHDNANQNNASLAILILYKINCRTKHSTKNKKGYFI